METTTIPKVIVSEDGDALISQGLDHLSLYISRILLPAWLSKPDLAGPTIISSPVAAALFAVAAEVGAVFLVLRDEMPPSARPDDLCLSFWFPNGLHAGYFSREAIVGNDAAWLRKNGYDLAIGPDSFVATTKSCVALRTLVSQSLYSVKGVHRPAAHPLASPPFCADVLARAVQAALFRRHSLN